MQMSRKGLFRQRNNVFQSLQWDGRMDGQTDGWTDKRTDGQTDSTCILQDFIPSDSRRPAYTTATIMKYWSMARVLMAISCLWATGSIFVFPSVLSVPFFPLYRVILKKVSFGIFRTILVSKEETNFTIKSKDKGLSLS